MIFLVLKAYNRMRKPADVAAAPPEDVLLLREIRDSLRAPGRCNHPPIATAGRTPAVVGLSFRR